jgi:hypothetical protein
MVQHPGDLRAREVRIGQEARPLLDHGLSAVPSELITGRRGPPVLPDDGVAHGLAAVAVPEDRSLSLVRDADGGHVARAEPGEGERLRGHSALGCPDLVRILLHPTRLRVDLADLPLRHGVRDAVGVENDRARARRSLVQRKDIGHRCLP